MSTEFVSVTVYDSSNKEIVPDEVTIIDNNNVTVTFTSPVSGQAAVLAS